MLSVTANNGHLHVKFELPAGMHALFGASGAGKTSLFRLIAGLDRDDTARVLWSETPIHQLPPHRRPIALAPQRPHLVPHRTVREQVKWIASGRDSDALVRWARALSVEWFWSRHPSRISGGELQRASLLRALAADRPVLLLDEPLSQVDRPLRHLIMATLKELLPSDLILFTTHDWEETEAFAEQVVWITDGRSRPPASPVGLLPDSPPTARLMGYIGSIAAHPGHWLIHPRLIRPGSFPDEGPVIAGQLTAARLSPTLHQYRFESDAVWLQWTGPPAPRAAGSAVTLIRPPRAEFSLVPATPPQG
ncbi:MAG: ATP-binding cassette domain-containing protein [Thermaerobacter sp.]|nr:ATP-binding cassette domain-containing protein [Thermaerobacter sp.]